MNQLRCPNLSESGTWHTGTDASRDPLRSPARHRTLAGCARSHTLAARAFATIANMVYLVRMRWASATYAIAVAVLGAVLAGCASGRIGPPPDTKAPEGPHTLKKLSVAERQQVMERANVWRPLDTSSLDLIKGPVLPASQRIPAQVTCTFVFPDKPLSGMTPKFQCDLGKDDVVKVKYGEKNGEVYAEVAASRLLWALGFQADVMYPTRVTCRNCPADPFAASGADWQRGSPTDVVDEGVRSGGGRARKRQRRRSAGLRGLGVSRARQDRRDARRRHARAARCVEAARGVHPAFGFEAGPAGDRLPGRRASGRTRRATRPAPRRGW